MKIPKRVNNALDWVEGNIRVITVVTALVVVSVAALLMPALAAFVLGALVAGVAVRWRMTRRLVRLRAEVDELLRENGALRHEKTVLSQGIIASSGQLTQKLPIIPRADAGSENAGLEKGSEKGSENAGLEKGSEKGSGNAGLENAGSGNAGSERGGENFPDTERLPIIPWAEEASRDDNEDTPLMGVIRHRHRRR